MRNLWIAGFAVLGFLTMSEPSFAQVQVGVGFDQLDRMEDKIDELLKRMERLERSLRNGRPGQNFEVPSSVNNDCVGRLYKNFLGFNERIDIADRCRSPNLKDLLKSPDCRQTAKVYNNACYDKLVDTWDEPQNKADLMDACATYTFDCQR